MRDPARRRVLNGLATAVLVARFGHAEARTMLKRAIPSSGETLPAIGLGTWQTFDVEPEPAALAPLREIVARYLALGGRVVDTSPMYGRAESVLGNLLASTPQPPRPFVATKIWTTGKEAGERQIAESEQKIGRKPLDLVQVHNLVDVDTHLDTLDASKADGRVRYTGVTHYTRGAHAEVQRVANRRKVDFIQINYSLAEREAERRLLPFAHERGVAVLINRPFAEGALFARVRGKSVPEWARIELDCASWAQFFLKFIVSHPAVTAAIPATSKLDHLLDNLGAGAGAMPDAAQREKMAGDFAAL